MKKTRDKNEFFASCPKRIETLLEEELASLGCTGLRQTAAGVYFSADLAQLYNVCLWSRLANRVLMPLANQDAKTSKDLYSVVYQIPWEEYLVQDSTFLVDFVGTNNEIKHSQFGAQRVKDAVVDRYVRLNLPRPNVDKASPDVRINARLSKGRVVISLDISGESLHRRGYREKQGVAPLKENLAAALLMRAGWPKMVEEAQKAGTRIALIDPMCGSGTFLIEAAMMAANIAPGLLRKRFGFERLSFHDADVWQNAVASASGESHELETKRFPLIAGFDSDRRVLDFAKQNIKSIALDDVITVKEQPLQDFKNPSVDGISSGLLICNPPYGERLGEINALKNDYRLLGQVAKQELPGWKLAIFTSNEELVREMRLRNKNKYQFFNGAIPAQLFTYDIVGKQATLRKDRDLSSDPLSDGAAMVANRLVKNQKRLAKWLKKENIECYRVYDADIPEYAAAIDVYGDQYHIQEYQAPKNIDEKKAERRFQDIIHATVQTFGVSPHNVISKTRMRQRGKSQYEKINQSSRRQYFEVREGQASLSVNLRDYLDTGIFLDHRPLRKIIADQSSGKRFLNLFCYTATATVHAALGGASSSVSVDMSNTYLDWARQNFALNNISTDRHILVRSDCVQWLKNCRQGFDLIMLDPPTFSNSKNTATVLDIQKDHADLVSRCMEILAPGGVLFFSNNLKRFVLDPLLKEKFVIEDITQKTIDVDFERNKKIHHCWKITHK